MKEIVLALKDSIESRVKHKVVASFLIAWALLHWKGISLFLLSEKKDMINIIRGHEFTIWDDFFIPLICGVVYITLFQLVLYAGAFLAEITDNCISKLSAKNAIKKLNLQRKLNNIAILSEYEYQKETKKEKLRAIAERNRVLEARFSELEKSFNEARYQIGEHQSEYKDLEKKYNSASLKIENAKIEMNKITRFMDSLNNIETNDSNQLKLINGISKSMSLITAMMPGQNELAPYRGGNPDATTEVDTILSQSIEQ